MILGLFLGSQTMVVSEAGLLHKASKAEVEINWKKQMQLSEGAVSENVKDIVNEFLGNYSEAGGVKIDKALSTFLTSKGLDRNTQRTVKNILLSGKLVGDNNQIVKASTITLQAIPADDDDGDDEKIVKKKKKKNKKAKKQAKKDKKKLKKQNKNKGKKSKKFQEEEIEEALDEENEELDGVPAPDDEDDYEEEE